MYDAVNCLTAPKFWLNLEISRHFRQSDRCVLGLTCVPELNFDLVTNLLRQENLVQIERVVNLLAINFEQEVVLSNANICRRSGNRLYKKSVLWEVRSVDLLSNVVSGFRIG